jgi:hypothetical protein
MFALGRAKLSLALIGSVATAGCAASHGAGAAPATMRAGSAGRLDSTEFRRAEFRTIGDAIRVLRPDWIAVDKMTRDPRAADSQPVIGVFIEGHGRGYPVEKLAEYLPTDVRSVRRILASESRATYGPQWGWGGVVLTLTR